MGIFEEEKYFGESNNFILTCVLVNYKSNVMIESFHKI